MTPEEVEKLLAGYATGTLDETERRILMQAALERQELFDALAEEEALRELLSDPRCRRQLLALLGAPRAPLWRRVWAWSTRPVGLAAMASSAAALVLVSSLVLQVGRRSAPPPPPGPLVQTATPKAQPPAAEHRNLPRVEAAKEPRATVARRQPAPAAAEVAAAPAGMPAPPQAVEPGPSAADAAGARALALPQGAMAVQAFVEEAAPQVRYQVLKDGVATEPGAVFRPGDRLALSVESARNGRILVFRRNEDGSLGLLFPSEGQDNRITPGGRLLAPVKVREEPGEDTLLLVLAPETPSQAARTEMRAPARAPVLPETPALAGRPPTGIQIKLTIR